MTISKEYLQNELESTVEARRSAQQQADLYDGAAQFIQLLISKLDEPELAVASDAPDDPGPP